MDALKDLAKTFYPTVTISCVTLLCGGILGIIGGVKLLCPKDKQEKEIVTSRIVLEELQDQSFLITKSIILDQETKIVADQGSDWSNWWWGHEINAKAGVLVDVGVDLTILEEEDIEVDESEKKIFIDLPDSQVYDSSLEGEIELSTKSGILKVLFASDDNEDYNLAMQHLTEEAQKTIEEDDEIMESAKTGAIDTIQLMYTTVGYEVALEEN